MPITKETRRAVAKKAAADALQTAAIVLKTEAYYISGRINEVMNWVYEYRLSVVAKATGR